MSNVVDFKSFLDQKANEANVNVLQEFMPHDSQLTLSMPTRLEIVGRRALVEWMENSNRDAPFVTALVYLAQDIYRGIHLQFNMLNAAVVQQDKEEDTEISLYMYGAEIARFEEATENNAPLRMNFQLQLSMTIAEDDISNGGVVDRDGLVLGHDPESSLTINQLKRIMQNMEELVTVGGGKTRLTDDGKYVAIIRYSPRHVVVMTLVPEVPITRNPHYRKGL
jgi:hypothetical protein